MIDRISSSFSSHQRMIETEPIKVKVDSNTSADINKVTNDSLEDKEQIKEIVTSMNKFMEASHTSLKFQFHEDAKEYYVTIVDDITKEVVKEIPSKKVLDMYAAMTDFLGLMVDRKI